MPEYAYQYIWYLTNTINYTVLIFLLIPAKFTNIIQISYQYHLILWYLSDIIPYQYLTYNDTDIILIPILIRSHTNDYTEYHYVLYFFHLSSVILFGLFGCMVHLVSICSPVHTLSREIGSKHYLVGEIHLKQQYYTHFVRFLLKNIKKINASEKYEQVVILILVIWLPKTKLLWNIFRSYLCVERLPFVIVWCLTVYMMLMDISDIYLMAICSSEGLISDVSLFVWY